MGSMGDIIGESRHFEIYYHCNVSLDTPRFHFDVRLKENRDRLIENEQSLLDLFVADLQLSYADAGGIQAKLFVVPPPAKCFQVLKTKTYIVYLLITHPEDRKSNDFVFYLYDNSNRLIDSYCSMEGDKASGSLEKLWDEVDQ